MSIKKLIAIFALLNISNAGWPTTTYNLGASKYKSIFWKNGSNYCCTNEGDGPYCCGDDPLVAAVAAEGEICSFNLECLEDFRLDFSICNVLSLEALPH